MASVMSSEHLCTRQAQNEKTRRNRDGLFAEPSRIS
jgi:hypothetical protein